MHNNKNGPQFPAKEGAKNHRVKLAQPRVLERGCLTQDTVTPTGENRNEVCEGRSETRRIKIHIQEQKGVQHLHIGTYNVRSLMGEDRLLELEEELQKIKWDILGLAETI